MRGISSKILWNTFQRLFSLVTRCHHQSHRRTFGLLVGIKRVRGVVVTGHAVLQNRLNEAPHINPTAIHMAFLDHLRTGFDGLGNSYCFFFV